MKQNHKKKLVSGLMMSTLAFGGAVAVTSSVTPLFGGTTVAYAESPFADNTSQRTVTLTKFAITSQDQLGAAGNGTVWDNPNNLATLEGVHFQLIKVIPIAGKVLNDASVQKEGVDYTLSTEETDTHDAYTDDKGQITFDLGTGKANDGIYLLKEIKQASGETITNNDTGKETTVKYMANDSFIHVPMTDRDSQAGLLYDINVYPKNQEETPLNPVKTMNDSGSGSIVPGQSFKWQAAFDINPSEFSYVASEDSNIPGLDPNTPYTGPGSTGGHVNKGETVYLDYLRVTDDLDPALDLLGVEVQVKDNKGAWVSLTETTDYTFTKGAAQMAPAGLNVVELTKAGMEKVGKMAGATQMRVVYETTVNDPEFDGIVKNDFTVDKKLPGLEPDEDKNPITPTMPLGGFDIEKTGEDTKDVLEGAEFRLATSEKDARDGKYLASDGKSYKEVDLPDGVTFIQHTTDDTGRVHFAGLELDFTDGNDNGYLDLLEDGTINPDSKDKMEKEYWVVETKAPDGYELLKDPVSVLVNLETKDPTTIELDVEDKVSSQLPFTGAKGTTIMIIIAIGTIAVGTALVVLDKKRSQNKA